MSKPQFTDFAYEPLFPDLNNLNTWLVNQEDDHVRISVKVGETYYPVDLVNWEVTLPPGRITVKDVTVPLDVLIGAGCELYRLKHNKEVLISTTTGNGSSWRMIREVVYDDPADPWVGDWELQYKENDGAEWRSDCLTHFGISSCVNALIDLAKLDPAWLASIQASSCQTYKKGIEL